MAKRSEHELAIKIAGRVDTSLQKSIHKAQRELQALNPAFQNIEKLGVASLKAIASAATVATTAVTGVVAASTKVGMEYEKQMSSVQAISGATSEEFAKLDELAKELGASTQFSASQVGEGMEYMAMAGWKTNDMLAGMEGVLNLAAASGEDLATTSDIVTDAMTAFGLGADQVGRFSDVLASASSNANTNVAMMGETFKYAAPVAGSLGYSIEDTALAIGLMANSGIKASQAGTALRTLFTKTTDGINITSKALGKYRIETQNADGSMREFSDIMVDLREAFSQMTEGEQAFNAQNIAGQEAMSGLLAIVNAGEGDFNKLSNAINNSTGAAKEMSEIKVDNLSGDITKLGSALEGVGIDIYQNLSEPFRAGVQYGTELVGVIGKKINNSSFIKELPQKIPTAIRYVDEFTDSLKDLATPILNTGKWLLDNPQVITGFVVSLGTALITYKVASGVTALAGALTGLSPAGLAIMGIGAVIGIITGIGTAIKKSANEAKKASLDKHFGNIALSMEELSDVASHIIKTENLEKVSEVINSMNNLSEIKNAISDYASELDKMDWKISIGMELTDSEKSDYQADVQNYIQSVEKYLNEQRYSYDLQILSLGSEELENSDVTAKIRDFYADKQSELSGLGKQLNDTITEAFQDGLLDFDEMQEIQELREKMAKIQSEMATGDFEAKMDLLNVKYSGAELTAESFANLQKEIQDQIDAAVSNFDETYVMQIANTKVALREGAIDYSEYLQQVSDIENAYNKSVGEIVAKGQGFLIASIEEAYKEELSGLDLNGIISKAIEDSFYEDGTDSWIDMNLLNRKLVHEGMLDGLSEETKNAISELLNNMSDNTNQMKDIANRYREAGQEIPEAISEALSDTTQIAAVTGDVDALWSVIGETVKDNEEYTNAVNFAKENGMYIPQGVSEAIEENTSVVKDSVNTMYQQTKTFLENEFKKGFDVNTSIRLKASSIQNKAPYSNEYVMSYTPHATGGIMTKPHIGLVAEAGPEAIIPLDGSQNARELYEETGKLLNMPSREDSLLGMSKEVANTVNNYEDNRQEQQIHYSPSITINGNANQDDIERALEISQERFERLMEQYLKQNRRVSFS